MEKQRFRQALEVVLAHEGGYVNDPADPGGETKYGISKRSYPHLDIKSLTKKQAAEIYYRDWWLKYTYGDIADLAVATKAFDLSVNMGSANAHRILQRAVNWTEKKQLKVDGILGSKTLTAVNQADPVRVVQAMRFAAAEYYYLLAKNRSASRKYLFGWLNRAYS